MDLKRVFFLKKLLGKTLHQDIRQVCNDHDHPCQEMQVLGLEPEKEVNGIDIMVNTPTPLLAIEVETGKSNVYTNLVKLKNSQVSACFMVATSKKALMSLLI